MNVLYDLAYLSAMPVAVPFLLVKSWRTGKYRSDFAARFGRIGGGQRVAEGMRRLMLHCVSVGELASMRLLIDRLLAADKGLFIILTTTTDTGTARARDVYNTPRYAGRVATHRYPLDLSFAVEAFLDHTRPDAIALVELETWPNFISIAAARRIPIAVINGRLTARSARRYAIIRPIIARMMRKVDWFGIQTEAIARRFERLGAETGRIEIIPTLKYDSADFATTIPGQEAMAAACGIAAGHVLFVGGSTGPGEEEAILEAYLAQRKDYPELRLAIAPRQPATVPQVEAAIAARGMAAVKRSGRADGRTGAELRTDEVLVVDTFGELRKLYSLAAGIFVGRSLVELGGSDMIEAAALAKPICFGPHTHNFAEVVELLVDKGAARVVHDGGELAEWLGGILRDRAGAELMGATVRGLIAAQGGSTERYVRKLLEMARKKG